MNEFLEPSFYFIICQESHITRVSYSKTIPVPKQRGPGLRKQEISKTIWFKTQSHSQSDKEPQVTIINSPFIVTNFQLHCEGRQTCLGNKNVKKLRRNEYIPYRENLTLQNEIKKI